MQYSFDFSPDKNRQLKQERNISFEDVIFVIESQGPLDIIEHLNKDKYPNQKLYIVEIDNYAYIVPVIVSKQKIFMKTIFPSRKATKEYLRGKE